LAKFGKNVENLPDHNFSHIDYFNGVQERATPFLGSTGLNLAVKL
jgi:hypothetical protein